MKLRFIEKRQETGNVWSFYFKPLKETTWRAGQSIRLELPRATWGYDERRFTISSAPHEAVIQITTRLSGSAFKQLLDALVPEQEINAYNIEGEFTWNTSAPKLCIAGGIGVTPFRALILDAIERNASDDVILLHRGSDKPAIFAQDFEHIAEQEERVSYHHLARRLDIDLLNELAPDWKDRDIYIAGTPVMIREIMKLCSENGVSNEHITTDIFTGNVS